jgi:ribosome-associated protein
MRIGHLVPPKWGPYAPLPVIQVACGRCDASHGVATLEARRGLSTAAGRDSTGEVTEPGRRDERGYRPAMPPRWLRVSPACRIDLNEVEIRASRSGGPGGQHANTSDTAVEVAFDLAGSRSLGSRQRSLLLARLGPVVRARAADTRSQARNRDLALERLADRLADGLRVPRPRHATRPSRTARRVRVETKRRRGDVKRNRARPRPDQD